MAMIKYKCEICGKEETRDSKDGVPECCGQKMKQIPLDVCNRTFDAESYRPHDEDDACDEGYPDK